GTGTRWRREGQRALRGRPRRRRGARGARPGRDGGAVTFLEALALPFLQRALAAGVLIAVGTGLLGVFVVQRRLSFLGDGLAHAAFGGTGIGAFTIVATCLGGSALALLRVPIWIVLPFRLRNAASTSAFWRSTDDSCGAEIC